jgi:hypothetical protein
LLRESTAQYSCLFNYKLSPAAGCIQIKQLLFYLLFLKSVLAKSKLVTFTFSFKRSRSDILVFTKAPYRYKLSKHQFFFCRFFLVFKFSFFFFFKKMLSSAYLYRVVFLFCTLDFCFFPLYYFKLDLRVPLEEWLI